MLIYLHIYCVKLEVDESTALKSRSNKAYNVAVIFVCCSCFPAINLSGIYYSAEKFTSEQKTIFHVRKEIV